MTWLSALACKLWGHKWRRNKAIGAGAKQCARCGLCLTVKPRKAKGASQ